MIKSLAVKLLILPAVGGAAYLAGGGHLPLPATDTTPPAVAAPAAQAPSGGFQVIATCDDPQEAPRAAQGPTQARKAQERTVTVRVPQAVAAPPAEAQRSESAAPTSTPAPSTSTAQQGGVNLNTATEAELEALPGIGAKTAARIIASRPIAKVEDIKAMPGVTGPNYALFAPKVHV